MRAAACNFAPHNLCKAWVQSHTGWRWLDFRFVTYAENFYTYILAHIRFLLRIPHHPYACAKRYTRSPNPKSRLPSCYFRYRYASSKLPLPASPTLWTAPSTQAFPPRMTGSKSVALLALMRNSDSPMHTSRPTQARNCKLEETPLSLSRLTCTSSPQWT